MNIDIYEEDVLIWIYLILIKIFQYRKEGLI